MSYDAPTHLLGEDEPSTPFDESRWLIRIDELGTWCQKQIETTDQFAAMVIEMGSEILYSYDDTWTPDTLPKRAKVVMLNLCRRGYLNPQSEITVSIAGGPAVSNHKEWGAGMQLTEAEVAVLSEEAAADSDATGDLFVFQTYTGTPSVRAPEFLYTEGSDEPVLYGANEYDWYAE